MSCLQITLCVGTVLTLFLACTTTSLLIPLLGTGNNMIVVKEAAAHEEKQLPSLSPLSDGYTNSGNNSSIMNSNSPSSLPLSYSQRQQLLLLPPPEIFDRVKSSVVQITPLPSSQGQNASLLDSGFVYDREGDILTNQHVVREMQSCCCNSC
ncbi:MAG: hypothetical protein ACJ71F_16830 [Nitrososphaeraceae archaeon]